MTAFQAGDIPRDFAFNENSGIIHPKHVIVVAIPLINNPNYWGAGHLSFGCDFGDVRLRYTFFTGSGWTSAKILDITSGANRVGEAVPAGATKFSVGRVKKSNTDYADYFPASWLLQYQSA